MKIEDIRLTPEEHWEIREKHYRETSEVLGAKLEEAIANTATDKAIRKIVEYLEANTEHEWGIPFINERVLTALKNMVNK